MPSALETLIKILKLERDQGCNNTAVIGGLSAYSKNWQNQAHDEAKRPEQHVLVDEISVILENYNELQNTTDRLTTLSYIMDRVTGRLPIPEEYEKKLDHYKKDDDSDHKNNKDKTPAKSTDKRENKKSKHRTDSQNNINVKQDSEEIGDQDSESSDEGFDTAYRGNLDIEPEITLEHPPRSPRKKIDADEASDIMQGLNASVLKVKGVGPKMAESLNRLGIETINDLLFFLPHRYDDYTKLIPINKLQPNQLVTVIGTVRHTETLVGRNNRKDFSIRVDDGSASLGVRFFGQHYLANSIRVNQQIVLRGKTSQYLGRIQLSNPQWELLDPENLVKVGIVPIYSLTEGLKGPNLRRLMKTTVNYWSDRLPDYMPYSTLERTDLGDLGWSIKNLHFPESQDHLAHARRRFVFDELILMQLAILGNRREWQSLPADPLEISDGYIENFLEAVFPYTLTKPQRRAVDDIRRDISSDIPMNRLLQGDVGSGKTAVAIAALGMAFENKKQAALMAPTGILAEQHYRNLLATFDKLPVDNDQKPVIKLLTGSLTTSERTSVLEELSNGDIDIIIGTHALIQEDVEYHNLALVIIDEQHRFGVQQRGNLRSKGKNPHLLVMTATPIPRTLALTLYADLDLTIIDEMPPGRIPVNTRIIHPVELERVYNIIEHEVEKGRQAFIVYPLVESSDNNDAKAAVDAFEELSKIFYKHRVGLLHGRMKPAEKDSIMESFSRHEFDIMVTTSVAEVGVDIPNASIIVIEGANRFGLSQLHQFRGRVGRGQFESFCLLIPDKDSEDARQRLEALESTNDGFKLAEIDWKMRGAGDLIGTKQSGQSQLQLMEEMTPYLVDLAQREARTLYEEDPSLQKPEHRLLKERVEMLYNPESDIS